MITTIEEFRKYVPELTTGVKFADIEHLITTTVREEVLPIFGVYAATTTGEIKALLQEAVANLAAFRQISRASVKLSGAGAQKVESQNMQSLFKYEKNDFREIVSKTGYSALESALQKAISVNTFQTTPQYQETTARLLNFSTEIRPYKIDFQTFRSLLPFIELVERESVKPILGANLYSVLSLGQYGDLTGVHKDLLKLLREALSQYAVQLALELSMVNIYGNQVFVREWQHESEGAEHRTAPRSDWFTTAQLYRAEYTARYFAIVKQFLIDNKTDLAWVDSTVTATTTSSEKQKGFVWL